MRNSRSAEDAGFTLIEVMVALMVIAIALPALLGAVYRQVEGTAHLRDKSIAQWVASNKLTEARIQQFRSGQVFQGRRSGVTEMADRDWYWWLESTATEVEDFYRVEVRVATGEDRQQQPLYSLVGFAVAPVTEGIAGAP
jgi:general secretion pathway protein I